MKEYSYYGYNDFIICASYKQHVIKEWFADYYLHNSDITFDFSNGGKMEVHNNVAEPWKVTIIDECTCRRMYRNYFLSISEGKYNGADSYFHAAKDYKGIYFLSI